MVLRPLTRQPGLDGLDLFRRLDPPSNNGVLADEVRIAAAVDQIREAIQEALGRATSVRGWRAQALFASLVVALDGCQLMTFIDTGDVFFDGDSLKPADYFLVLRDGSRLVVDVKEISTSKDPGFQETIKLSSSERDRLVRFADLYGAELYIAAYTPMLPTWLLLPIGAFSRRSSGSYVISIEDGFIRNESAIIGDYAVGVRPPLKFQLTADTSEPRTIGSNGHVSMKIGGVHISSGAGAIQDPFQRRILMFLLQYGSWEMRDDVVTDGKDLVSITNIAEPFVDDEATDETDQGVHIVGWLSGMYSRLFEASTQGEEGVTALDMKARPGWFETLIPHDYEGDQLPLWRLVMNPKAEDDRPNP